MDSLKKTYVLVHGAWHGAWSFAQTKAALEELGAAVVTFDLPGHGDDKTEIPEVTLDAYAEKVIEELNHMDGKVILVGHSLSGFVVTKVAEKVPEKIEKLIFIAAMIPNNGKTVFDILSEDKESQLLQNLIFSEDKSWATVNEETLLNVVYNGATNEQINTAAPNLVHQATQPFFVPVTTSVNFNQIPKAYIICTKDKVISQNAQQHLIDICEIGTKLTISTGHVPQIENSIKLASILLQA
jgi:pimeloyl-ACP methyl ester carboxylesterase